MLENVINGKWPGGNIPYGFYLGPDKHLHLTMNKSLAFASFFLY